MRRGALGEDLTQVMASRTGMLASRRESLLRKVGRTAAVSVEVLIGPPDRRAEQPGSLRQFPRDDEHCRRALAHRAHRVGDPGQRGAVGLVGPGDQVSDHPALDTGDFVRTEIGERPEPEPLAMISAYLRGDKNLSPEAAAALEAVIKVTYDQLPSAPTKDCPWCTGVDARARRTQPRVRSVPSWAWKISTGSTRLS